MQLLGRHATEAEEQNARGEEHGLQELLAHDAIAYAPAQQGANVGQVACEVSGADGQGLAPSRDAVHDSLREGKEQQALRSVVVALATVLLAVVHHASGDHSQGRSQKVGRISSRVDELCIRLAVACEERSEAERSQKMSELGATRHDQTACVTGVSTLVGDGHAHVEDRQGVDQAGGETQNVLDQLKGEIVAIHEFQLASAGVLGVAQGTAQSHGEEGENQWVLAHQLHCTSGFLSDFLSLGEGPRRQTPKTAQAHGHQQSSTDATGLRLWHRHGVEFFGVRSGTGDL
mmetsp:Transcript_42191/g.91579  ORF Transcript_42191/g.91579 Transcript_42191/m.91579 type:complete len:289 (-) Transcript_42191:25-891(-)